MTPGMTGLRPSVTKACNTWLSIGSRMPAVSIGDPMSEVLIHMSTSGFGNPPTSFHGQPYMTAIRCRLLLQT